MQLTVLERMLIENLLPREANFANHKLLRVARENLSFTEEENRLLQFQQIGDQTRWDDKAAFNKKTGERVILSQKILAKDPEFLLKMVDRDPETFEIRETGGVKDIALGEVVTAIVEKALKELDEKAELKDEQFTLYEAFVEKPALLKIVGEGEPSGEEATADE